MNYWPTKPRLHSRQRSYLFITEAGLGSLTVPQPQAAAALRQLRHGILPAGAEVIPRNYLMRVESYKETKVLVARLTQGRAQRFQLRTVAARNEVMEVLRDHPAVKESNMQPQPLTDRVNPRLVLCAGLSALTWIAYELFVANQPVEGKITELAFGTFTYVPFVVLPLTVGSCALLAIGYSLWQARKDPPDLEEVLFM